MSESIPTGEKSHIVVRFENQVGILLRVGKHPRFHATLKERYSDFHVHEIDTKGNIVKLTSLEAPIEEEKAPDSLEAPGIAKCLTEDIRKKVSDLQQDIAERKGNFKKDAVEINVTALEKDERTKIHNWISNFDKLASTTVDKDGQKLIVVSSQSSKTFRRPANRAKYTHCVLYKEGLDTSSVIGYIAKKLNLKPHLITYAGTKDRQAKTTQRISIPNIDAARLVEISDNSKNSKLGNYEYLTRPIFLGCLSGNHFTILLKNLKIESDSVIDDAILSLKNQGFINYYGLQRFGSFDVSTHDVGKALLQANFLQAFDLILKEKNNDPDFLKKAKEAWLKRRDPYEAKKYFPHSYRSIESNLIFGLLKFHRKKMYVNAFQAIPRNTRTLYVHAVQSYLWNRMASYRIEKYGLKPIVGDLVYSNPNNSLLTETEAEVSEGIESEENPVDDLHNEESTPKYDVIIVTEGNKSRYSIFDILLPLPGPEIKFPKNGVKDFYESLLREDGLATDCFLSLNPQTDRPKGAYRKMMVRPKNVSYEIISYTEGENLDSVIESDIDKLGIKLPTFGKPDSDEVKEKAEDSIDNPKKTEKCVKLELSLPSSSYATMALRELLVEATENAIGDEIKRPQKRKANDESEIPTKQETDGDSVTNGIKNESASVQENVSEAETCTKIIKLDSTGNGSGDINDVTAEDISSKPQDEDVV